MNYIEANLSKDEEVKARIKHSWAGLVSVMVVFIVLCAIGIVILNIKPIILALAKRVEPDIDIDPLDEDLLSYLGVMFYIFGAVIILMSVVYLIASIVEIKSAQLVVTNKRIFGRRGFIAKHTTDVLLSKVDTINISNGFFGAIFHYGTMEIVSAGSGRLTRMERATLKYGFVANTLEFRKVVLETIDNVKREDLEAQAKTLSEAVKQG